MNNKSKAIKLAKTITFPAAMATAFYFGGVSFSGSDVGGGGVLTVVAGSVSSALIGVACAFAIDGAFEFVSKFHSIFKQG